ncbi:hypothetical protein BH09PLA1_BH09PLA1_31420 [soil metagenome]
MPSRSPIDIRPTSAALRLAVRWTERAAADIERELQPDRAGVDRSSLQSRLGKLQSGRRLLQELTRRSATRGDPTSPLRIAGKDACRSARSQADHTLDHVASGSLAQIASALNANVFRFNRVRSRELRMTRAQEMIEFAWTRGAGASRDPLPHDSAALRAADASAIARGGGERISLVQFFNAGSFQAAFTAGVNEQARALNIGMNQRDPADGDLSAMKQRIDSAIADARTSGLIVHSGPAMELHPLVERARRAGKAVVTSNLLAPPLNTPSIVLNDIDAGALLTEALLADLLDRSPGDLPRAASGRFADSGVRGRVLLIGGGDRELQHMRLRQQGFLDAIAEQRGLTCRAIPGSGASILPKLVEQLKRTDRPVAIVAFYDDVTRYAAQAIEISRGRKRTKLYGVDLGDPEIEEMESHDFWRASIAFDAFTLGAACTRLLAASLRLPRWIAQQHFPIVIDGVLIRREQMLTLRDRTAAGLAQAIPQLRQSCDAVVKI